MWHYKILFEANIEHLQQTQKALHPTRMRAFVYLIQKE